MPLVTVPDRDTGGWEINADAEIANVTSRYGAPGEQRDEPRSRWGEYKVWRLVDGRYTVLRASYSVLYHTRHTSCRITGPGGPGTGPQSGRPATVDDLPDDAEPCERCRPAEPEDLPDGRQVIRYEFPRQSVDVCATPRDVIKTLTEHVKWTGDREITVSEPVRAVLEQLRANDPAFADIALPMQRIG